MASADILGNIAIIKESTRKKELAQARELIKKPGVKTVLATVGNVRGRLRTIKTRHVMGEKNLVADYKENNCRFRFNIETCYFSSRLAGERKLIAGKIRMKDSVLVMFAGVGVFPIVIYKLSKPKKIVGIEIGKECCRYFRENLKLNKIPEEKIELVQGDVKKKTGGKFDVVIMARPNLKESFLKWGLKASKKNTRLFYHAFCNIDEIKEVSEKLVREAKELGRKIKIREIVKSGDIAPYKFRFRIEFRVLD
ncbi:hypothetical protein GF386_04540 [Candidatus Pacearchaeota archaeon]|nr:hypothetical protein [Candidatus Pacearchaeota archaeon]MBD3283393.1 hypothetical protein [Candidatus Pacearchaeota archaeon]